MTLKEAFSHINIKCISMDLCYVMKKECADKSVEYIQVFGLES